MNFEKYLAISKYSTTFVRLIPVIKLNPFKAMSSIFRYLSIIGLIAFGISSCKKLETYPTTPVVTFKSLQYRDTTGRAIDGQTPEIESIVSLSFDIKDGDGDLGISSSTGTSTIDLFMTVYGLKNGIWEKDEATTNYVMPDLEPIGQNKAVYATIRVDAVYIVDISGKRYLPYDTIKCEFYVYDRAKHKSNIDSSGVVVISKKLKY